MKAQRMNAQIITTPAGEELIVLPKAQYDRLIARVAEMEEDEADGAAYDAAKAAFIASGARALPAEVSQLMLKGENLLRALRTWRGMTQVALAEKAGIRQSFLSDLEAKRRHGSPKTLSALALALDVPKDWIA